MDDEVCPLKLRWCPGAGRCRYHEQGACRYAEVKARETQRERVRQKSILSTYLNEHKVYAK